MDAALPPLLLGPSDQEGPALAARRTRALRAIARARIGNAWMRLGASALAAAVAASIFETMLPLYWLAGLALVIFIDSQIYRGLLARCDAGDPPARIPRLLAWTALQSAYGNGLAAILWFAPLSPGQPLAAIFICGGLANTAATLRHSAPLSIAALIPTAAYLLGLPVVEFVLSGYDDTVRLVPVVGALLLLAWGVQLWQKLAASDAALAHAEAAATRERQAGAAAAAAKNDLIRRVNGELRTPMQALIGAAEHLRRSAATPESRAHIATLMQAGEVLRLALADISDLERLESGQLRIEPKPADARELLRGVVTAFRVLAQDKHLELFLDIAPDIPARVELDAARVRQVLFNLLANAIRYTTHGGVRVRLTAQPGEAEGKVRLAFTIADTGCGMSRSQLALLFGQAPADEENGRGLAISLKLARLLGGRLHAKSELGQGSMFSFTIEAPIIAAAAARGAA